MKKSDEKVLIGGEKPYFMPQELQFAVQLAQFAEQKASETNVSPGATSTSLSR